MTKEELKELEELEELEKLEALAAQEEAQEPAQEMGQAEAFGLGAMEGIPFAKDLAAGQQAMGEAGISASQPFVTSSEIAEQLESEMDEEALGQVADNARRNKREWDKAINEAEDKYPATFFAGDVLGGAVTAGATGVSTLPGIMAFGAAEGVSRSEDRGIMDAIEGAALAGTADVAMRGAGKALSFMGKKLGLIANRGIGESVGAMNKSKVRELDTHVRKMYLGGDSKKKLSEGYQQFAKDMLNETTLEGKPFLGTFQTIGETQLEAARKLDQYGQAMGKVLKEADEVIDVDTSLLHSRMVRNVSEGLAQIEHPEAKKIASKLLKEVDDIFLQPPKEETVKKLVQKGDILEEVVETKVLPREYKKIGLKNLHDIKVFMARQAKNAFDKEGREISQGALELRKQVGITAEFIDEVIEDSGIEVAQAANYKELKKKWANMLTVERLAADEAASKAAGPMKMLKDMFSVRGFIMSGVATGTGNPASAVAAVALNQAMSSSRTPLALAKGLGKLSQHIQNVPSSPIAKNLAVAATLSIAEFEKEVQGSIAKVNLMESPVSRDFEDVKKKRSSIVTMVEGFDPALAGQLDDAIINDDVEGVSAIMDGLSKVPAAKGLIQSGIGWNGKVYSEEDKASLEQEIRRAELPIAQEIVLLEELNQQGKIPNIEPVETLNRKFIPRDKSKHSY
jgi:hypothetical protein